MDNLALGSLLSWSAEHAVGSLHLKRLIGHHWLLALHHWLSHRLLLLPSLVHALLNLVLNLLLHLHLDLHLELVLYLTLHLTLEFPSHLL
jgi:hypothetical protein